MKHAGYFLIIFLLSTLCLMSMEDTNKIIIGPEINDIKFPVGIRYFDDDHLIIHDQYRFNMVNIRKKAITVIPSGDKNLLGLRDVLPIVHNGNKKILTLHNSGTQMFNINTGEYDISIKTDALKHLCKCIHHPLSNSVLFPMSFYQSAIRRYDYITHQTTTSLALERETCAMTVHPKKEVVCRADWLGNISFYHFDDLSKSFKKTQLPIITNGSYFCEYTPQGDNIAIVVDEKIFKIDATNPEKFTCSHLQREGNNKLYPAPIAFHPNGILAMVCNINKKSSPEYWAEYKIYYWDIVQNKSIYTTAQIEGPIIKYLTFAPNGKECAVFLSNNTCEVMPVSFEVLYQSNAKQIMCYCLSVLNRLKEEQNLPQDITKYVAYILLAALKR
jgi:hypothetical protein